MNSEERNKIFVELFKEHEKKIYRLCYAFLSEKNLIDDLFQEILINIWNNLHSFRNEALITTWIYRIAVNTAMLYNKREKKRNNLFSNFDAEQLADKSQAELDLDSENSKNLENLRKAISLLEEQDRLIVSLYLEEMSYKDISEIVGISAIYVGVKINRIKQFLEKTLAQNEQE